MEGAAWGSTTRDSGAAAPAPGGTSAPALQRGGAERRDQQGDPPASSVHERSSRRRRSRLSPLRIRPATGASALGITGRRLVVHPTLERVRTILLRDHPGGVVVGVDVALAVAERGGALVVGIAQVRRNLLVHAGAHVVLGPAERHHDGVGLGRPGQVDHRLGQVQGGLRQADVLDGPGSGLGHQQGLGVGQADVLAGQDDHAAGQEAGVLPRLDHAGHPVQAGVGVRAPHALDQGADLVVVLVGALVEQAAVPGPGHVVHGQHHRRRRDPSAPAPGPAPPRPRPW